MTELPGDPTVLVANLPYNVSVPVLLHFLETFPYLQRGVVMVQAEVGERLAAPPGSKIYGAPSVKAAWYGPWRLAGHRLAAGVLAGAQRRQRAGRVRARRRAAGDARTSGAAPSQIVDAAFQQRRKMLRQALSAVLGGTAAAASAFSSAPGSLRPPAAKSSAIDDFVRIARALMTGGFTDCSRAVATVFTKHACNISPDPSRWRDGERVDDCAAPTGEGRHAHGRVSGARAGAAAPERHPPARGGIPPVRPRRCAPRTSPARSRRSRRPASRPDGVVFTGDLVDLGEGDAYADAARARRAVRRAAGNAGASG